MKKKKHTWASEDSTCQGCKFGVNFKPLMEPNPSLTGYYFKTSQRVDPFVLELVLLFAKWSLFQNTPTPWVITNNNSFVQGFALVTLCKLRIHFETLFTCGQKACCSGRPIQKPFDPCMFFDTGGEKLCFMVICSYSHSDLDWTILQVEFSMLFWNCTASSHKLMTQNLKHPQPHSSMFRKTHRWWVFSEVLLAKCVFSCLLVFVYALVYSAKYLTGQSSRCQGFTHFFFFKYMLAFIMDLFDVTVKTQKAKRCNMW